MGTRLVTDLQGKVNLELKKPELILEVRIDKMLQKDGKQRDY